MLRFMADEWDDTCSTIFPLLSSVLSFVCPSLPSFAICVFTLDVQYKKSRKNTSDPLEPERLTFLASLLGVLLQKMKWDESEDIDDMDDDDKGAFEFLRKVLSSALSLIDHILTPP